MCTECNNNKLTIVELQAQIEHLRKDKEKLEEQVFFLTDENKLLERAVLNLVKTYVA